jgi:hypothetical protein
VSAPPRQGANRVIHQAGRASQHEWHYQDAPGTDWVILSRPEWEFAGLKLIADITTYEFDGTDGIDDHRVAGAFKIFAPLIS